MSFFAYKNGEMHAEGVALATIAAQVGTPFYCYSAAALRAAWREFADGIKGMNASVCYAMKANSNLAVVRLFGELGAGADIVSVGEMRRALAAGIPAKRIIYSGVGKKASELMAALQAGVGQINVESSAELETLNAVAGQLGVKADITIRVNPDVDAGTHAKITTGRKENKFGIDIDLAREAFALAGRLPNLKVVGVAMHIGSQLTSLEPYRSAIVRVRELIGQLRADGHSIDRFDIGGGLGIVYADEKPPSIADFLAMVARETAGLGLRTHLRARPAPGRRGGRAGERGHPGEARCFQDFRHRRCGHERPDPADLVRGVARHRAGAASAPMPPRSAATLSVRSANRATIWHRTVICRPLAAGDLVMIRSAGAYGAVMASTYNSRPLAPGSDGRWHAICGHPAEADDRRDDLRRAVSALDGAGVKDLVERKAMDASQTTAIQAPGLGRKIGLAWAALAWEGLWPRLVPLLAVVALFVAAAHLDLSPASIPGFIPACWPSWRWPLARSAGGVCAISPGPRAKPPSAVSSATAACRTGRWSPCRIALPPARTIRWRPPCGKPIAAARPRGWPASPTSRRIPAWPSSTPGRCASCRSWRWSWRSPWPAAGAAIAWPRPSRRPFRRRRRWSPTCGSRRRPIPASRRSISTWPSATSCCACRSAASSRASSTTCAAASRRKLVIDGKGTEFATVGKGKYQIEQVITEGNEITCRRAATSRRAGSCTSFPTWRRPSSSPSRSASTSGRPRSSTSPATISA